jgi:mono/diheme cytochrome c family protein
MRRALRTGMIAALLGTAISSASAQGDSKHGQYLAKAGGCLACHTAAKKDAVPFAGGRALKTPFGTFYGPNITPDPEAGIGRWNEADFVRAMRLGMRPDGTHLFPAFPYTSFTRIADSDLRDLWAYLRTLPPSAQPSKKHDLHFPFGWRSLLVVWKWPFFTPGPFTADTRLTPAVNRGAYLVESLGHCGECHTPRNFFGGMNQKRFLAGGKGPDGKNVPNLTPTRLKKWSDGDLKEFLQTGLTPNGDAANEVMDEVIRNTTSQLTPGDLAAMIAYLRSLPPLPDAPR